MNLGLNIHNLFVIIVKNNLKIKKKDFIKRANIEIIEIYIILLHINRIDEKVFIVKVTKGYNVDHF